MSTINYLILDTGEVTSSTQDEFTDTTIHDMTAWLIKALENPGFFPLPDPLGDYSALVDKGDKGLVCTIYGPAEIVPTEVLRKIGGDVPDEGLPLLIFGVALADGKSLWDLFIQGFYVGDNVIKMPAEPWVTVIPYEMYPHIPNPDRISSFQKCIARAWLEVHKKLH